METLEEYIQRLEAEGLLVFECKTCHDIFYPAIRAGRKIHEVFAPRHKASSRCRSGKHPHCTCDTCF